MLQWFKSYLSYCRQAVVVNTKSSSWCNFSFGVPQGSVIGPILFTLYISPIGDIVRRHNISDHTYADDTYLFVLRIMHVWQMQNLVWNCVLMISRSGCSLIFYN